MLIEWINCAVSGGLNNLDKKELSDNYFFQIFLLSCILIFCSVVSADG